MQIPDQPPLPSGLDTSNLVEAREPIVIAQHQPIGPNNPPWGVGVALLVWLVSLILMFVVPVIFLLPYAYMKGLQSFDPLSPTSILLQVIALFPTHLLTFAIVWMVVTRLGRYSFKEAIGWGWVRGVRLWSCIGLGVLLFIMGSAIAKLLGADKPTQLEQIINSSLAARYTISFLAVFTAPLVEELIYRGVLYAPLQRLLGIPAAVTIVLLLFTIIHVPQYWPNVGVIIAVALLSIVLTLMRAYSGRLLPCIVIHLVFNGVQAVLLIAEPHLQRFITPVDPTLPSAFIVPLFSQLM
ncbi:MAG TPA: type II CAAX endopeptidase family protein [Pyrinomonadaceae bacterium]|nr:type II CAAX endopeptidase family protein [Pyrinomonadaceae bacterium]